MRALIVYCHPSPKSFTAAVRDTVIDRLEAAGAETRLIDLYASGFDPVLSREEWEHYISRSYKLVVAKLTKKKRVELGIEVGSVAKKRAQRRQFRWCQQRRDDLLVERAVA